VTHFFALLQKPAVHESPAAHAVPAAKFALGARHTLASQSSPFAQRVSNAHAALATGRATHLWVVVVSQ
jgi:hypothetical protein